MWVIVCHSDGYEICMVIPRPVLLYFRKKYKLILLREYFLMRTKTKLKIVQDKILTRCDA
jgi:hypothetical protein